jgi:hypothetical protein
MSPLELLVNIDVDDLDRALVFYTTALPLTAARRIGPDGVELLGASSRVYLLAKPAGSEGAPGGRRDTHVIGPRCISRRCRA